MKLTQFPGYVRFWVASTVSEFGTYVTSIAISVIVVVTLDGGSAAVGLISAARWLPYLLLGLFAGVWVDRHRRKPILIASDLGRALILVSISALGLAGWLTIPILFAHMCLFGAISVVSDAAFQSFLPQLVPRELFVRANARLEQSHSVAQTTGPALAGWLTQVLTAPAALILDAVSYCISGAVVASVADTANQTREQSSSGGVGRSIRQGLEWIYRHPQLGPLAWTTHLWFIFSSMFGAVFTVYALRERDLGAVGLGVVLACAGVGAVLGTFATTRIGDALGAGPTIILAHVLYPLAFVIIAAAGLAPSGDWSAFATIAFGQFLVGLALGIQGPQEMGYWQAVTPDRLMGRMNATRRSVNRGMIVVGAPLGGLVGEAIGNRPTITIAAAGMLVVVLLMAGSNIRHARIEDQLSEEEAMA
ncbi:MAG: MFS transporter [Tepidiformaceae bacterium]